MRWRITGASLQADCEQQVPPLRVPFPSGITRSGRNDNYFKLVRMIGIDLRGMTLDDRA